MSGALDCGLTHRRSGPVCGTGHLDFSSVLHDWVNKVLGMSSRVCETRHIIDPMPLIKKRRALCLAGGFSSSVSVSVARRNFYSYRASG